MKIRRLVISLALVVAVTFSFISAVSASDDDGDGGSTRPAARSAIMLVFNE